ncbi:MAG: peptidylprolyl isomerase, partial [Lentisphaeraceae bacterium]|nr:peptidylprolyl isomerase [Lentisphaeraceae bacterium]
MEQTMQKIILLLLAFTCVPLMADKQKAAKQNPVAVMTTNMGIIHIELYAAAAPKTVRNFIDLAEGKKEFTDNNGKKVSRPYYDGLIFHRVIKNFMIQGGCPQGTGRGGPGYNFEDEMNADSLGLAPYTKRRNEARGYKYDSKLKSVK